MGLNYPSEDDRGMSQSGGAEKRVERRHSQVMLVSKAYENGLADGIKLGRARLFEELKEYVDKLVT